MYHIGISDNYGAKYAILPGDPDRVEYIASFLKNSKKIGQKREYTSYIGYLDEDPIIIMSTGMGGPSTAIALEELYQLGVTNYIRVGTCGGMNLDVIPGDIVLPTGSIRVEGTSDEYLPVEFPAVPNYNLLSYAAKAAEKLKYRYHTGVIQCKDSFYGQHSPERMPLGYELMRDWDTWIAAGALASEMESATLFIVSQVLGARAVCVLNTIWNQERKKAGYSDQRHGSMDKAIEVSLEIIRMDKNAPSL